MAAGCPVTGEIHFTQTNLVSDGSQAAAFTNTNLVNAWGLAQRTDGPFWVGNNATGVATVFQGDGQAFPIGSPLVVTIAPIPRGTTPAPVTGVVFNPFASAGDFGGNLFIFVTEDGTIAAWQTSSGTTAPVVVDNSILDPPTDLIGAVYKGAALVTNTQGNFLLAANFRDARIDVFDKTFAAATLTGSFADSTIPAGFAPFNVVALGGKVYVSYAKQDADMHDDVGGAGNGFINEFNTSGTLLRRIATGGVLNSPWGMAIGPSTWNKFAGALIVGNFGDGKINAFSLGTTPAFIATLMDDTGTVIVNPGLWALVPGNGAVGTDPQKLYLTAGGANEDHGLFAVLALVNDVDVQ